MTWDRWGPEAHQKLRVIDSVLDTALKERDSIAARLETAQAELVELEGLRTLAEERRNRLQQAENEAKRLTAEAEELARRLTKDGENRAQVTSLVQDVARLKTEREQQDADAEKQRELWAAERARLKQEIVKAEAVSTQLEELWARLRWVFLGIGVAAGATAGTIGTYIVTHLPK